jgi:hypothetical protein
MLLRISKDGYSAQQLALTEGPFEWIAVSGKHHGNYFLLKSDHFELKLQLAGESGGATWPGDARVGPIHPQPGVAAVLDTSNSIRGIGSVAIASEPGGAEIYVDGKFVGQTPSTIPMPTGDHRVILKIRGRKDWERTLEVLSGSQLTLHPALDPAP